MNNDLYQTIENLKNTLANIDSARKQVSETVAAYSATQGKIQNYADKLDGIENGLKELILLLQKNKVVIEQQASSAVANLQKSCGEVTKKIQNEHEVASRSLSEMLSSKLHEVDRIVKVFDDTKKIVESLAEKVKETSDNLDETANEITTLREEFNSFQKALDSALGTVKGNVSLVIDSCREHSRLLNELKGEVSDSMTIMKKNMRTSRFVSLVALVLLFALLALHFIVKN